MEVATISKSHSDNSFKKEMKTRHIVMLALGGVIGTGLFLTSGYTVNHPICSAYWRKSLNK